MPEGRPTVTPAGSWGPRNGPLDPHAAGRHDAVGHVPFPAQRRAPPLVFRGSGWHVGSPVTGARVARGRSSRSLSRRVALMTGVNAATSSAGASPTSRR
jgi:hypothetical protein